MIKINDNPVIFLNSNKHNMIETIVDEDNYYDLIKYAIGNSKNYASIVVNKKRFELHRYIMNYTGKDIIDHINHNPLDNRKINLRIATRQQNSQNTSSVKNSSSKYVGVSKTQQKIPKYSAQIVVNNKKIHLGYFESEIEAAKVRDIATKKYFGEFGNLNF